MGEIGNHPGALQDEIKPRVQAVLGRAQAGLGAATAREPEATQLYEPKTKLTALHDPQVIAQILANQIHDVAVTDFIECVPL